MVISDPAVGDFVGKSDFCVISLRSALDHIQHNPICRFTVLVKTTLKTKWMDFNNTMIPNVALPSLHFISRIIEL